MDTDITVTQAPTAGSGGAGGQFDFARHVRERQHGRRRPGPRSTIDNLNSTGRRHAHDSDVTSVSKLGNVAAVAGGLTLTDTKTSFTIPNFDANGGGFQRWPTAAADGRRHGSTAPATSPRPISAQRHGPDRERRGARPAEHRQAAAGRTLAASGRATPDVALLDSNYAKSNKLTVGGS